jgi:phosphoserine phosphatase
MKKSIYLIFSIFLLLSFSCSNVKKEKVLTGDDQTDAAAILPSWNEGDTRSAIIDFVSGTTTEGSVNFIPTADRIAVFDNDGTLWIEKPLYIPIEYEIDYLKKVVPKNPEMARNKLYMGLSNGDLGVLKDYNSFELINLLFAAHNGQPEDEYEASVYTFLSEHRHPEYDRPFKELIFQPMLELIDYLQANDFKVFIVTGGELSFVRTVSEEIYNIPQENVVGSNILFQYESDSTGVEIIRTGKIVSANDKQIKPANIELHIGKKPIFAAGNSDGDYEMMEYTLSGDGPSMAILVHHDDEEREYSYTHGTEKAIEDSPGKGWYVVSMKNDWKRVFSFEE